MRWGETWRQPRRWEAPFAPTSRAASTSSAIRRVLSVARPRVGVVANGEEEGKGTYLTGAAALRKPTSGVHFKGTWNPETCSLAR